MLKLCATGDSILMCGFPESYAGIAAPLREYILQADIRIANMETTISEYDRHASTFCGGTWLTAPPSILKELDSFGFQYYGFANNHTMDYSYGGLRSTIEALDAHGVKHSGAGEDLASATRHAAVKSEKGSVGIIAVTTTCDDSARAGDPLGHIPGRPGVNMLRHSEVFSLNAAHMAALKEIADTTGINGRINNSKRGGYTISTPGMFNLGSLCFREAEEEGKMTRPNGADSRRILAAIAKAKEETDYVVLSLHSHEIKGSTDDEPDYFLEEFSHSCIDAGAAAVICSGTHQIKAIEIYRGAPIFYSIANFIFQSDKVAELPRDFYEKYNVPQEFSAEQALNVRSANGTRGLQTDRSNYMGIVPTLYFDAGQVKRIVIQPTELCFDMGTGLKGLPRLAEKSMAKTIFDRLCALSAPYGTALALDNGRIEVTIR